MHTSLRAGKIRQKHSNLCLLLVVLYCFKMYNQYSLTQEFVMTSGDGLEICLPLLLLVSCGVRMVSDFLRTPHPDVSSF